MTINFKRGDTFGFYANLKDYLGSPLIIDVANLKSQIRNSIDKLVAELVITSTETPGQYLFRCMDTTNWNIGTLFCDIEISNGSKSSSETFEINVVKDVTRDE